MYDRLELGECAYVLADTGDAAPYIAYVSLLLEPQRAAYRARGLIAKADKA